MPRSNRQRRRGREPSRAGADEIPAVLGGRSQEQHEDGEWAVRPVIGQAATKPYRCPGCDQVIPAGTPHLVAWPIADLAADGETSAGLSERRHWHTPCWRARGRRRPRRGPAGTGR